MSQRFRADDDNWGTAANSAMSEIIRPMTKLASAPAQAMLMSLDAMASPLRSLQRATTSGDVAGGVMSVPGMRSMPMMSDPSWMVESDDSDLSGDDTKAVRYSIFFTKPDYVMTLQPETEILIDYSTDGASLAGRLIGRFLAAAAEGTVPKPDNWDDYLQDGDDQTPIQSSIGWSIRDRDQKYIVFRYRVAHRLPKQERNYDRDDLEVKRNIFNELRRMRQRLG